MKLRKKTNILYITPFGNIGGGEVSLLLTFKYLNREKFSSVVVSLQKGNFPDKLKLMEERIYVFHKASPLHSFIVIFKIIKTIISHKINLVHINGMDIRGSIASWLCGKPAISHLRVIFPFTWIDYLNGYLSKYIITISKAVQNEYCKNHPGLLNKTKVIYNAVDFKDLPCRYKSNIEPIIGAIGRIHPCKGYEYLIESLTGVQKYYPLCKLIVIGGVEDIKMCKNYYKILLNLTEKLNLSENVKFIGFKDNISQYMQSMDLIVMPSVEIETKKGGKITEGFGRVLIEAMAMEIPVIASKVGGIPEIIEHNVTGILVPQKDPKSLTKAILDLLKDKERRMELGKRGREKVIAHFGPENYIKQVEGLYNSILKL